MKGTFLVGIDLGVSLIKVGIYDVNGNRIETVIKDSPGHCPKPGIFEQSGNEFLKTVIDALNESMIKSQINPSSVEAIAFSGQMGGAIGVDRNWEAVTCWSNPLDTRYTPYIDKMLLSKKDQILKLSGTNFPYFAPKILWWKNEFPDLYKNSSKFMFLSGFIAGKMGNIGIENAYVDRTYLEMSGIADIPNNNWSSELCNEFGIDISKLPRILNSTSVIGKLDKSIADVCGLKDGIPLVAGAGDKPAGYLGAGMVEPGLLIDEAASFATFSICVDEYIPDIKFKTLENIPSPIPGNYFPTVILVGSGATHKWFRDTFGNEEKRVEAESMKSAYEILDEKAKSINPGSDKLLSIGLLGGRANPSDPDIRGMWIGFSWGHKKEHFYRSLLESFAYEYAYTAKVMRENYPNLKFDEIRVIGGGAVSDFWNQIKCDIIGIPYIKLNRNDFALLGDIIIAGNAIGIFDDLGKTAKKFSKKTKEYLPNKKIHEYYKNYVNLYEGLFERVRELYVDLKNIPDFD